MSSPIPIPTFMTYADWAARLYSSYSAHVPLPGPESLWYDWAVRVYQSPAFVKFNVPNPYSYLNWRDWAFGFWKSAGGLL